MLIFIENTQKRKALYKCDCGKHVDTFISNVNSGHTKSCGCLRVLVTKHRSTTHGHKKDGKRTKVYAAWVNMKSRCNNLNRKDAKNYIGRGIDYCERWGTFSNFIEDMGEPLPKQTLDRIDNNQGYSKENCRWADMQVQSLNKRNCTAYTYQGRTQTIAEWGRELEINSVTLHKRLQRGIPIDIAFATKGFLKMHSKYKFNI